MIQNAAIVVLFLLVIGLGTWSYRQQQQIVQLQKDLLNAKFAAPWVNEK